jgi:hypothetical protein
VTAAVGIRSHILLGDARRGGERNLDRGFACTTLCSCAYIIASTIPATMIPFIVGVRHGGQVLASVRVFESCAGPISGPDIRVAAAIPPSDRMHGWLIERRDR